MNDDDVKADMIPEYHGPMAHSPGQTMRVLKSGGNQSVLWTPAFYILRVLALLLVELSRNIHQSFNSYGSL